MRLCKSLLCAPRVVVSNGGRAAKAKYNQRHDAIITHHLIQIVYRPSLIFTAQPDWTVFRNCYGTRRCLKFWTGRFWPDNLDSWKCKFILHFLVDLHQIGLHQWNKFSTMFKIQIVYKLDSMDTETGIRRHELCRLVSEGTSALNESMTSPAWFSLLKLILNQFGLWKWYQTWFHANFLYSIYWWRPVWRKSTRKC